jgi:hypothetical protein
MPPIMSKPSKAAHMAILFVTVGALLMVWSGVWYAWMLHQMPPDASQPHKDGWLYLCYAIFLSGLVLFIIGFLLGRIGRAGRRAELPHSAAAGTSIITPSGVSSANSAPVRRRSVRVSSTIRLRLRTSSSVLIIGNNSATLPWRAARRMARSCVRKNSG